jgi:hypothetical protein
LARLGPLGEEAHRLVRLAGATALLDGIPQVLLVMPPVSDGFNPATALPLTLASCRRWAVCTRPCIWWPDLWASPRWPWGAVTQTCSLRQRG